VPRELVAIGASWGGLRAVGDLLAGLPEDFAPAVVVVQHRSRDSAPGGLEQALGRRAALPVCEPGDKDPIEGGRVYVAAPDYHLMVEDGHFELSVDDPVTYSRPSIDVLFDSVADSYAERAVGVVLTGASSDGAEGLLRMRRAGALTIAQDPDDAERREMPEAAVRAGAAVHVRPLAELPRLLAEACSAVRAG
jgi:two-component system, chemotaxis family, protein-glutamate methylesterase/glutaminase